MRKFIYSLLLHDIIIGKDDESYVSRHGKEKKKVQNVLLKNIGWSPGSGLFQSYKEHAINEF